MYNAIVLEHLENPRNVGELRDPSAIGEASNPVCGDQLVLHLKIPGIDGSITEARFRAQACPPCIAAASVLTEMLKGMTLEEAKALSRTDVADRLAPLPPNKAHCAMLAIDCLQAALLDFENRNING